MDFFNNICKKSNLELKCSSYKGTRSKGIDLIHILVKDSKYNDYFNLLKEYLGLYPDKVNLQNEKGWTPLMIASINSNTTSNFETVKYLLEQGAFLNIKDKYGWTALMYASKFSNTTSSLKTVKLLLEHNADPNIKDIEFGLTALMMASKFSNKYSTVETVEYLLEYGADPNIQDNEGFTALMTACCNPSINNISNIKVIELLLENNSDPNIKNYYKSTALMIACNFYHERVVEILLKYGASYIMKNNDEYNEFFELHPEILEKYKNNILEENV